MKKLTLMIALLFISFTLSACGIGEIVDAFNTTRMELEHTEEFGKVTIHYNEDEEQYLELVMEAIHETEQENNRYLSEINHEVQVYLVEEEAFAERFSDDYAGMAYGFFNKIFINTTKEWWEGEFQTHEDYLRNIVAHEYTHYRMMNATNHVLPLWFMEGYAEFIATKVSPSLNEYNSYFAYLIPFQTLEEFDDWDYSGDYFQAGVALQVFMDEQNEGVIQELLEDIDIMDDFYDAFERHYGAGFEDFESAVREELKRLRRGAWDLP